MEALLELFFTMVIELVNLMKFKNPKTRTKTMTIVVALFFAILSGLTIWGAVSLYQQGSIVGAIVMGAIALAFIVFGVTLIVRGNRTDWEKY